MIPPQTLEQKAKELYPDESGTFLEMPNQSMVILQRMAFCAGHQSRDEEVKRLREALEKIACPLKYLQNKAEEDGCKLDGIMAIELSNDSNWLKSIAEDALK